MKKLVTLLTTIIGCFALQNATLMAAPYLKAPLLCDGGKSQSGSKRYPIVDWDGKSRYAQSERVYDFRIECDGATLHIIDLFLNAADADRYEKRGGSLYKHTRDERKSVMVRDEECRTVYRDDYCERTPAELYEICHGNPLCGIDNSAYRCKKPQQRCRPAQYEMRYEPVWEPFPVGYAPLPRGARIIEVAQKQVASAPAAQPPSSQVQPISTQLHTTPIQPHAPSSGGGAGFGMFFVLIIAISGAIYWFRDQLKPAMSWGRHWGGSGYRFEAEDGGNSYGDYARQKSQYSFREQRREEAEPEVPSDDAMPQSMEEACRILNVGEETEPEVVNKIYRAMAHAWHVDQATDEEDRKRREKKMKQLNAAKEYIMGRRS